MGGRTPIWGTSEQVYPSCLWEEQVCSSYWHKTLNRERPCQEADGETGQELANVYNAKIERVGSVAAAGHVYDLLGALVGMVTPNGHVSIWTGQVVGVTYPVVKTAG